MQPRRNQDAIRTQSGRNQDAITATEHQLVGRESASAWHCDCALCGTTEVASAALLRYIDSVALHGVVLHVWHYMHCRGAHHVPVDRCQRVSFRLLRPFTLDAELQSAISIRQHAISTYQRTINMH